MCKGNLWGYWILYEIYTTMIGRELMVVFFAL